MSKGRQMISTRFDDETIKALKKLAEERKTSVAALIREAVMALHTRSRVPLPVAAGRGYTEALPPVSKRQVVTHRRFELRTP